jgi:hypothetical protein
MSVATASAAALLQLHQEQRAAPRLECDEGVTQDPRVQVDAETASEVFSFLIRRSARQAVAFEDASIACRLRGSVVRWFADEGDWGELQQRTVHLAARLFDGSEPKMSLLKTEKPLLAAACMLIASKYEEVDGHATKASTLMKRLGGRFSTAQLLAMEIDTLEALCWSVGFVTPVHVFEALADAGLVDDEEQTMEAREQTQVYCRYFLDVALCHADFALFQPHVVATACVAAARAAVRHTPVVGPRLSKLVRCMAQDAPSQVTRCFELLRVYAEAENDATEEDESRDGAARLRAVLDGEDFGGEDEDEFRGSPKGVWQLGTEGRSPPNPKREPVKFLVEGEYVA